MVFEALVRSLWKLRNARSPDLALTCSCLAVILDQWHAIKADEA